MKNIKVMAGCWRKGGLHAHTIWSDGYSLPERAIGAVKKEGYDFWTITDHIVFPDKKDVWREVCADEGPWPPRLTGNELGESAGIVPGYPCTRKILPWITQVRLMTFREMCRAFNEPGKFVLLPGSEFTHFSVNAPDGRRYAVHANMLNVPHEAVIPKEKFFPADQLDMMYSLYCDAVKGQKTPSCFQVNHPFWPYYDVLSTMMIERPHIILAEICNGHPEYPPAEGMPGIEAWWDAVNSFRLADGKPCLWGTASDDSHFYDSERIHTRHGGVGGGFVVVHLPGRLTPGRIIQALQRGDFYASAGACFDSIVMDYGQRLLKVKVRRVAGAHCRIRFNATKKGFDRSIKMRHIPYESDPRYDRDVPIYSDDIGRVVYEKDGWTAQYRMEPDDLYVRATAVTDIPTKHIGRVLAVYPAFQMAWTQPMVNA